MHTQFQKEACIFLQGNEQHVKLIKEYRQTVEKELADICDAIQKLLDTALIPAAQTGESKVFYYKMCGALPAFSSSMLPNEFFSGRETITVIMQKSTPKIRRRTVPWKLTRRHRMSQPPRFPQPTPSAWDWPSTSACFTTRSSRHQRSQPRDCGGVFPFICLHPGDAIWPSKRLMML